MQKHNKKAAMEMSVGTIVTIVLLMSVLVLGIFMVQRIFTSSTGAIDQIDSQMENEINKLFSEEGKSLVVFPSSRKVELKKGDDAKGFAFSINNKDVNDATFTYTVSALDSFDFVGRCGSGMTKSRADGYLVDASGLVSLSGSMAQEIPELILFEVPDVAPSCTIPYILDVKKEEGNFLSAKVYVTIK